MPGTIQSIERAAAMLRLLGSAGRPLALAEIAAPLDLAAPDRARHPAHAARGRVRRAGPRHRRATPWRRGCCAGSGSDWDRHDLRSRAMNWADSLAARSGQEVLLGMPAGGTVELVHHVFRPDDSPQRLRTGAQLPLHATALGKCLLAFAPIAVPRPHELDLQRYTGAPWSPRRADRAPRRRSGTGAGRPTLGEHRRAWAGSPRRCATSGGLVVGALGVGGPVDEMFNGGGPPAPRWSSSCSTRRGRSRGFGHGRHVTERVVAAIDQGTTSTRCLLFDPAGRMVAVAQREHRQYYPRSGWVEHDAEEIWRNVTRIVPAALRSAGHRPGEHRRARHREPARDDRDLGPRTPGRRWPAPSPGRTPGPRGWSPGWSRTGAPSWSTQLCGLPLGRLLRRAAAALAARPRARARGAARRPATCCSARWRAGWSGG